MPQVSSPPARPDSAGQRAGGPAPHLDGLDVCGVSQRGCKVDVPRSRVGPVGQLEKAIWRFSEIGPCTFCVTVLEGMGASKWLHLFTTFLFVALLFPRKSAGSANSRWTFFFLLLLSGIINLIVLI